MVPKILDKETRIINAAVELARVHGYDWITRNAVADKSGISAGSIHNSFGTIADVKRAVLKHAVKHEVLEIVAQGLAAGHPITAAAPDDLKRRALASVIANA